MSQFFSQFFTDSVTQLFTVFTVFILLVSLIALFLTNRWASRFVAIAPGILTSIGVLGTFIGINIGLQNFDVSKIEASVPSLLAGLKLAFSTSIVGMSCAIAFTIFRSLIGQRSRTASDASPQAVLSALEAINKSILRSAKAQNEAQGRLRESISGDGETSLNTQVQKLRIAVQDGDQGLLREFQKFAATVAENNSKALIAALELVIRDFNRNLTEQFGENFRQLNAAVGKLVEWQDQYADHLAVMESRLAETVRASEASKDALADIVERVRQLTPALNDLGAVNDQLKIGVSDLSEKLKAFAEMKAMAQSAFPEIERSLVRLTDDFASAVRTTSDRNAETISSHQQALSDQAEKLNDLFSKFDELMQSELNRALQALAGNLASLSGRFVDDYGPLTEKLSRLVRVAEQASAR